MSICDELEELIPAYALDALASSDRARVEKHLRECPDLRDELATYQNIAARLSYAAQPTEPRPELKYRVLAAAAPKPTFRFSPPMRSTGFLRPAFAALAFLLLVAFVGWNFYLQNQLAQQIAADRQLAADLSTQRDFLSIVAYSDGTPKRLQGTGSMWSATGRLYGSANETTMALFLSDMPALAPDKVYQVWLTDQMNNRVSGGILTVDAMGRGWLMIHASQPLSQYRAAGVTVEPQGGSPQPTGTRIVFASFTP